MADNELQRYGEEEEGMGRMLSRKHVHFLLEGLGVGWCMDHTELGWPMWKLRQNFWKYEKTQPVAWRDGNPNVIMCIMESKFNLWDTFPQLSFFHAFMSSTQMKRLTTACFDFSIFLNNF